MQKKLQVTVQKIESGMPLSKGEWMEFAHFEAEGEQKQQRGDLYVLLSLKGRWGLTGKSLLEDFLRNLHDYYYQNPETQILPNLEQAVKFAHRRLITTLKAEDQTNTFFNLLTYISWGNILYIAQVGNAKAALLRKEKIEFIGSENAEDLKEELFSNHIHTASGLVKEGDLLILGLPSFWKEVDLSKLKSWLVQKNLETATTKIKQLLIEKKVGLAKAVIVSFNIGIFPSQEEVIQIKLPLQEEESFWKKKLQQLTLRIQEKIKILRNKLVQLKQKSNPVDMTSNQNNPPKALSPEVFVNMEKEGSVEPKIPERQEIETPETVFPTNIEGKPESSLQTEQLKENIESSLESKSLDTTQKLPFFQPIMKFFTKKGQQVLKQFNLIKTQLLMSQKGGKSNKGLFDKEDPNTYLKQSFVARLFMKRGWLVVILLCIALVLSVFFTNKLKQKNESQSQNEPLYQNTLSSLEEAKRVSFSDSQRQEVYQKGTEAIVTLEKNNFDSEKVSQLKVKLQELTDVIFQINHVSEPKVIADLSLKKENISAQSFALVNPYFYILDALTQTLFIVNIENGTTEETTLSSGEAKIQSLIQNKGELYGFSEQGIKRYKSDQKQFDLIISKSDQWQKVISLAQYYGNFYLLDVQAKGIWKYIPVDQQFSEIGSYLKQIPDADFSKGVSLTTDGSVYVLLSDAQVWKFTFGERTDFTLSGIDKNLNEPIQILSQEDFKNIYILDRGNQRVVIFNKDGKYQKQYVGDDWSDLKAMEVEAKEKKLYLLNKAQILEISLN